MCKRRRMSWKDLKYALRAADKESMRLSSDNWPFVKKPLFPYTALTDFLFITETPCVYSAVRTGSLNTIRVKEDARVRSRFSPFRICGGQSGTGKRFLPVLLFSQSVSFHQCATLIFIYLFLWGQTGEAWEHSKKQRYFGNRATVNIKVLSLSL